MGRLCMKLSECGFQTLHDMVAFLTVIYGCMLAYAALVAQMLGVARALETAIAYATVPLCVLGFYLLVASIVECFRASK